MAGDWLKIEASTPEKPEVFEIATMCKITPADAFGRVFLVWRFFDQHTEKGNASNVTWAYLDHLVGVTGFAKAMHDVGWLVGGEASKAGVTLPNFARHNGKTAKSRALTAKRVSAHKERNANDEVTRQALPREEKRRSKEHGGFEEFWKAYPRKVAKQDALRAWGKIADVPLELVLAGLERAKASEQWRRDDGKFIPHAATWLNGRRWEDEQGAPLAAVVVGIGKCHCGAQATMKVGNQPRCPSHARAVGAA